MLDKVARVVLWLSLATTAAALVVGIISLASAPRDPELHTLHANFAFVALAVATGGLFCTATTRIVAGVRKTPSRAPWVLLAVALTLAVLSFGLFFLNGLGGLAWS